MTVALLAKVAIVYVFAMAALYVRALGEYSITDSRTGRVLEFLLTCAFGFLFGIATLAITAVAILALAFLIGAAT